MPSTLQLQRTNQCTTVASHNHHQQQPPDHPQPHRLMPLRSSSAAVLQSLDPISQLHHTHTVGPTQCCSAVVRTISAPLSTVWSVVRRFDNPQAYKHFLKSCHVIVGEGEVGSLREVHVVSGLPAASSRERLDILDDERHVMSFSVVGGDHRLTNYKSVTTVHAADDVDSSTTTVVVESYVVDIPNGNTWDDTCAFVDTIVKCNLQSLAQIAEDSAKS